MPTILDLAGIDPPPSVEGRSILEGLLSGQVETGPCYFETLYGRLEAETGVTRLGIVEGGWKFIYNRREEARTGMTEEAFELYDLKEDPAEIDNLAPRQPGKVRELRARLEEFLKAHPPGRAEVLTPDESTLRKLQRLGYF
jgi:arylsulfatase